MTQYNAMHTEASERIKFAHDSQDVFFHSLKRKVSLYFLERKITRFGNSLLIIKSIFWIGVFVASYILILSNKFNTWQLILLTMVFGFSMFLLSINIAHDASHHSFSSNPRVNKALSYVFELIGANSKMWDMLHNKSHHPFVNLHENDLAIATEPFLRLSPDARYKRIYKYQHFYAFFLYSISTIFWVFAKDFKFFRKKKVGPIFQESPSTLDYAVLIVSKLFYLSYTLVIPILVLNVPWWYVIIGFVIMHVTMGITLGLTFQTTHSVAETEKISVKETKELDCSWAYHVLRGTSDFSTQSRVYNWFFGGLNTHVAHHLFPNVSHVHYPAISLIIKETAGEFGYPYIENKGMFAALRSHFRYLKRLGKE